MSVTGQCLLLHLMAAAFCPCLQGELLTLLFVPPFSPQKTDSELKYEHIVITVLYLGGEGRGIM